jgi:phenylalanyl-tRNA synthetase beta chain
MLETLLYPAESAFAPAEFPGLRPGRSAQMSIAGAACGCLGEAEPDLCSSFAIERPVYIFELDYQTLVESCTAAPANFSPLPKFPPIERDLAVLLPEEVSSAEVSARIRETAPELIESVSLFDLYKGDQIPAGKKSLAFSIRLRSPDRTLEDSQADATVGEILKRLRDSFGAALR